MDIKVGQLARAITLEGVKITKIIGTEQWTKLTKGFVLKGCEGLYLEGSTDILKTADNLEELLEINDIVHWEYIAIHQLSERDDDFKEVIQKCQSIIDDEYQIDNVKNNIKFSNGKITAIELHENRVIQKIGE